MIPGNEGAILYIIISPGYDRRRNLFSKIRKHSVKRNVCATASDAQIWFFALLQEKCKKSLQKSVITWAMRASARTASANGTQQKSIVAMAMTLPLYSGSYSTAPQRWRRDTSASSRRELKRRLKDMLSWYKKREGNPLAFYIINQMLCPSKYDILHWQHNATTIHYLH